MNARMTTGIRPAPELIDEDLVPLLGVAPAVGSAFMQPRLRGRLMERVAQAAAAGRAMFTARGALPAWAELAEGVCAQTLYSTSAARLRPGEPRAVSLVRLQRGARWQRPAAPASQRPRLEWLVIAGRVRIQEQDLGPHDFHAATEGAPGTTLVALEPTLLYLREAPQDADAARDTGEAAHTQRDIAEHWHDFAPGIRRRVLWSRGPEAAMLYRAEAGAAVPRHTHGHDEECLMLDGELFLDDILLRTGEYQLAPAGTGHDSVVTDTGALIYARGDLDLAFVAS